MIETRPIQNQDHADIIAVTETLPNWFDEDARKRSIPIDLQHQNGFIARLDGTIVGFMTLFVAEGRLNIGWLGVHSDYHNKGIGSRLLLCAEEYAKQNNLTEIATYTLGAGVDYAPYEATRQFYFSRGFTIYQTSKTDNPGCPEEIKIKKICNES